LKTPTTIYFVARTHGLKRHLLKHEDLQRISRAKDLAEIHSLLLQSDYSERLSKISPLKLDAYQLERIVYEVLSERSYYLLKIARGSIRRLIEGFCRRTEVENLKRVVRAIHGNESMNRTQFLPVPREYQTVNFLALLECRRVGEIIKLLKETPFRDLGDKVGLYERYNNPLILEAYLDRIYYSVLEENLKRVAGGSRIQHLVGTEIDIKNLSSITSLQYSRASPDLLKEIIIEYYYRLPRNLVSKLVELPYEEILKLPLGPPYRESITKAIDLANNNMLPQAENILWQYFYSCVEKESIKNPGSLVYVISYLFLCRKEARNLATIAAGKQFKMGPERIQSLLFV